MTHQELANIAATQEIEPLTLPEAHKLASYAEQNATREASAFIGDEYDWSHVGQLGDGAICREEDHG